MSDPVRPDYFDRSPEGVAAIFRHFGREEATQLASPLYEAFCEGAAEDPDLLAIAARATPGQTPVNMLFAAVQFLLLEGVPNRLASFYPSLSGCPIPSLQQARQVVFPVFRAFCLEHRQAIEELVASRRVQTNVIQRCACLLPAFATVAAASPMQSLALVEIGPSAGLNLNWDLYRYTYPAPGAGSSAGAATAWGDEGSTVTLTTELRGRNPLPPLPSRIPVCWRTGIDVRPVDISSDDAVTWLRALIWPEHVERHARLAAAIALAREHPVELRQGDAVELLPAVMAEAPAQAMLTVFATSALYQIPRDPLRRLLQSMQEASRSRPVSFVSMEGTAKDTELTLTRYSDGARATRALARCSPHGRWMEWLEEA